MLDHANHFSWTITRPKSEDALACYHNQSTLRRQLRTQDLKRKTLNPRPWRVTFSQ